MVEQRGALGSLIAKDQPWYQQAGMLVVELDWDRTLSILDYKSRP